MLGNQLCSGTLYTNLLHSAMTSWSKTLESSVLHVSLWCSSISNVLLIVLILSFSKAFSEAGVPLRPNVSSRGSAAYEQQKNWPGS